MQFRKNDFRCPVCLVEFSMPTPKEESSAGCPFCKTILRPMLTRHDGYVNINWQDLRTLAIYSKRWASLFDLAKKGDQDSRKALENIIDKLKKFRPVDAELLTPERDQIADSMRRVEPDTGMIHIPDNNVNLADMKPDEKGNIVSPFFRKLL